MLRLMQKKKAKADAEAKEAKTATPQKKSIFGVTSRRGGVDKSKKKEPGEIRIQTDLGELDQGKIAKLEFPDKHNLMCFNMIITPDQGHWKGAKYVFKLEIPKLYPHQAPKIKCTTKIYHPNIDLDGNVCLNILRDEWKPIFDINHIMYGLIHLFCEPNPEDPLNHEAGRVLRENPEQFAQNVRRSLRGGRVGGETFPCLL
eukprot:TRINITY_DN774353_c0_g1_i1.p1 TRINITY_DN774353_c0_g1~~TRINITY_DN774353_c0_g1_i1.p1  ORF type:complete len:201 (-),score=56.45 TRINITY_DN774353_c0_g1_i1:232-834(-)